MTHEIGDYIDDHSDQSGIMAIDLPYFDHSFEFLCGSVTLTPRRMSVRFRTSRVFSAIFTMKTFLYAFFTLPYPTLKFHGKTDFNSFRVQKSTERKIILSGSLYGKVP